MKNSKNPRYLHARQAIDHAFVDLLKEKPYQKITITDITERARLAQHTFYNHYDSKQDLLNSRIDNILDKFFQGISQHDIVFSSSDHDQRLFTEFFQVWRDNVEIVKILNTVDIECLLVDRLREHYTEIYHRLVKTEIPGLSKDLADYIINFHVHAYVGILRQWFNNGMKHSPEKMGQLVSQFAGIEFTKSLIDKFKGIIR
jgi:AcrR family transcriptional regulator